MFLKYFFILALLVTPALAAPQFSQSECQQLNSERLQIRKQLRQPYTAERGKQLQAREKELNRLLNRHCKKPLPDPPQP